MMMERGDFEIFHEPFSYLYYVVEKRAEATYYHPVSDLPPSCGETANMILTKAIEKAVFFKDMAYHVIHHANRPFLNNFVNTFLIRDPELALLSHYKMNPNFTLEEAGYESTYKLFKMAEEITGKPPVVVDATDLENDPKVVVKAYCEAVGIPFVPESLTWRAEEKDEWEIWKEWHADAARSTGFAKSMEKFDITVDTVPRVRECYEISLPYYRLLHKRRIGAER